MSGGFRSRSKSGDPADRAPRGKQQRGGAKRTAKGNRERRGGQRHDTRRPAPSTSVVSAAQRCGVDRPRAVAFEVLQRVDADDAFANLTLPKAVRANSLSGRDAAFATELTYGTLRTEGVLDAVIAECSSRGLDAIAPDVLTALRMGTYQVL